MSGREQEEGEGKAFQMEGTECANVLWQGGVPGWTNVGRAEEDSVYVWGVGSHCQDEAPGVGRASNP